MFPVNCWDGIQQWWEASYFLWILLGTGGFEWNPRLNPQIIRTCALKLHLAWGQNWAASEVSSDFCGFSLKKASNSEWLVSSGKPFSQHSLNFSFVIKVLSLSDSIGCGRKFLFGFWLSITYQYNVLSCCEEDMLLLATLDNKHHLSITPCRVIFKFSEKNEEENLVPKAESTILWKYCVETPPNKNVSKSY